MDPRPLLLALALLSPVCRAQTPPDRAALLAEIDSWRHAQLVHVDPPAPLTAEFEPKLDAIEDKVKASSDPADLAQSSKDFKAWQHDLLLKRYALNKRVGLEHGTLNAFSKSQREQIRAIAAEADGMAQARLKQSDAQLFDGGGAAGEASVNGQPGNGASAAGAAAAPAGLHINDVAPPPPVTSSALSFSSLWNYIDHSRGYNVAEAVFTRARGFAGYCYASVKEGFIAAKDMLWAKIKSPTESGEIGIPPALAADYQRAVNKNPALLAKLGYRRVDVSTIPGDDPSVLPSGTLVDFAPRCAGYSVEAGHIEIIGARSMLSDIPRGDRPSLSADEALACSDGCHGRSLNYFRTYAKKGCMSMYVPVKA
ncbi:MAG TPA: hypothetical protein VN915_03980 [Elusimicrobiota bacterium]|nr:hypothetical protein [Elusimicrobiota bacterium]